MRPCYRALALNCSYDGVVVVAAHGAGINNLEVANNADGLEGKDRLKNQ